MLLRDIFSGLRLDYDSDPEGTPLARSNRLSYPAIQFKIAELRLKKLKEQKRLKLKTPI